MLLRHLRDINKPFLGNRESKRSGATELLGRPMVQTQPTASEETRKNRQKRIAAGKELKLNILPYSDDVSGETAAHRTAYKQMMRESSVKSAIFSKLFAVGATDLVVMPEDPESPREREIADFLRWNLLNIGVGLVGEPTGVLALIENLLYPKLVDGRVLAHKRWRQVMRGKYTGKTQLGQLKAKPDDSYRVNVDDYGNITNIEGMRYNGGDDYNPAHFVYCRYISLYGNPLGQSDLRSAYRAFWIKDTVLKLRAIYLEKFSAGFLVGKYTDSDVQGTLEEALANARSATWMSVPDGCVVEAINISSRGTADYEAAIRDLDHEIVNGIAGAALQMLEGNKSGSRAHGQVHRSTADLFIWYLAESLASDLNSQVIPDMCDLNYANVEAYPKVSFGGVSDEDLIAALEIDQGLKNMGFPLSLKEMATKYKRTPAVDEADRLVAPQQNLMLPAGGPASDPFRQLLGQIDE